jgi:hypothetical protein
VTQPAAVEQRACAGPLCRAGAIRRLEGGRCYCDKSLSPDVTITADDVMAVGETEGAAEVGADRGRLCACGREMAVARPRARDQTPRGVPATDATAEAARQQANRPDRNPQHGSSVMQGVHVCDLSAYCGCFAILFSFSFFQNINTYTITNTTSFLYP